MTTVADPTVESEEARVNEQIDKLLAEHPPAKTDAVTFLGAQFDLGLAWVHFPEGHGGLGVSPKLQSVINERICGRGRPERRTTATRSATACAGRRSSCTAPRSRSERYLRPLFTGEEIWCQLFSEPGAGSDVAGLSTAAVRDGDEWIVNGQKVWTTLAHVSRWGLLVAPHRPRGRRSTRASPCFVVDMHAARRRGAAAAADDR